MVSFRAESPLSMACPGLVVEFSGGGISGWCLCLHVWGVRTALGQTVGLSAG